MYSESVMHYLVFTLHVSIRIDRYIFHFYNIVKVLCTLSQQIVKCLVVKDFVTLIMMMMSIVNSGVTQT